MNRSTEAFSWRGNRLQLLAKGDDGTGTWARTVRQDPTTDREAATIPGPRYFDDEGQMPECCDALFDICAA
jgi:hypothetical protein